MTSVKPRGFTLIEVIVALAIASGALILLLMASQACMQRSMRAGLAASIQLAAESKLDEVRSASPEGAAARGDLGGHPGWQWVLERGKAEMAGLEGMQRLTLKVYEPQASQPYRAFSILAFVPPARKKEEPQP